MRTLSFAAGGMVLLLAGGACQAPRAAVHDSAPGMQRATSGVAGPVEGQLAAYNAHDLERFLSYYAPDVQIFALGPDSTSVMQGKDAMRQGYAFLEQVPPGFHAEILSRMVAGRYVIDHERIVVPGHPDQEALAIFEVRDSLITRVWFLPNP